MVGIVLVSHSKAVAESVAALGHMMAPDAVILAAGGLEDGSFGTDYARIMDACTQADQGDGAVILMDMGSAVMTAEMVLEDLGNDRLQMVDAPLVEGTVAASVRASAGGSLEDVAREAREAASVHKF